MSPPVGDEALPAPVLPALSPLAWALLQALAQEGEAPPMSLPRLVKRLGLGASVLMRELSALSEAVMGGQPGLGWVRVWLSEDASAGSGQGRWMAQLTPEGLQALQAFGAWPQGGGAQHEASAVPATPPQSQA